MQCCHKCVESDDFQSEPSCASLQHYLGEPQALAVNANRTFTEARQLLADVAKNRCGGWPVVGIAVGRIQPRTVSVKQLIEWCHLLHV